MVVLVTGVPVLGDPGSCTAMEARTTIEQCVTVQPLGLKLGDSVPLLSADTCTFSDFEWSL